MTTFQERFDAYYNARADYNSYRESLGYYQDNGITHWEPLATVDEEQELRLGAGAATRGFIDDCNESECEEF